jgi:hypothetical protein
VKDTVTDITETGKTSHSVQLTYDQAQLIEDVLFDFMDAHVDWIKKVVVTHGAAAGETVRGEAKDEQLGLRGAALALKPTLELAEQERLDEYLAIVGMCEDIFTVLDDVPA